MRQLGVDIVEGIGMTVGVVGVGAWVEVRLGLGVGIKQRGGNK